MPSNSFCHHCGAQLVVGANFCSKCGTSQNSLREKPPQPIAPQRMATVAAVDREDDDYIDTMEFLDLKINKLEVEIKAPVTFASESFDSLISHPIAPNQLPESRPQPPPISIEQFREDFKREAGSSRKSNE